MALRSRSRRLAVAKKLSEQQRRFVAEYLVDFNAMGAAERVGYSSTNNSAGLRAMQNPLVRDEIAKRCRAAEKRLEMTGDDIRNFHARVMCDPRDEAQGGPAWRDRIMSARELGKLLGLYTSKVQITGSLSLVDLLTAAADQKARQEMPALPPVTH